MTDIPPALITDPSKHFDWVRPQEVLQNFEMERILVCEDKGKETRTEIITFPDLDGKALHIPIVVSTKVEDYSPFPEIESSGIKIISKEFTKSERERFEYCSKKLKLPIVLSTYLTFEGNNTNLDNFRVPNENTKPPILLSVLARAGGGKTVLTTFLSLKLDLPTFSLDRFTAYDLKTYGSEVKKQGLNRNSDASQIVEIIQRFREENPNMKVEDKQAITMRQTLNEMLDMFKNGERPELVLVDGVGDKDQGVIPANIYHFVSMYSLNGVLFIAAPQDEHSGRLRLKPNQDASLEFTKDEDGKPINPPMVGIYFYTDLGSSDPWKMRPEVLEDILNQFSKSLHQITR